MTVQEELRRVRRIVPIAWLVTLACAGVFVLGHFLRQLNIVVNPLVWSSAQIIIALLSFTIAANVLVRYHGTGDRVSLILGLTLAVTGMIHLFAILEFYRNFLMREEQFRVPLSWMVGQTLLGLVFPHQPPVHPRNLIARPWEILPGVIFLAAAFGLRRIPGGDLFAFDAVLVWVAGINAAGHVIATQSTRLLDAPAAVAQLLSTIGCVVLLGATLLDNAQLFGQVRTLAISDSLTGLANYRHLVDVLQNELERSGRTNRSFSVLLMDLDRLKGINDRYGHITGSHALCRVADTLRLQCRSIDTAARYGGDEFALVLPETGEIAAQQVADRIRDCLEIDEEIPRLSMSIGRATFPQSGHSVQQLLESADRALYAMKEKLKTGKAQRQRRG